MGVSIALLGLQIVLAAIIVGFMLMHVASVISDAIKGIPGWKPYVDPKKDNKEEPKGS